MLTKQLLSISQVNKVTLEYFSNMQGSVYIKTIELHFTHYRDILEWKYINNQYINNQIYVHCRYQYAEL